MDIQSIEPKPVNLYAGGKNCINPQEFDILKVDNFYSLNVPIEFTTYTNFPDPLLILRMHGDLNYTQNKILEYFHKVTLGYLTRSDDGVHANTIHLPLASVSTAYGNFNTSKGAKRRSRFFATTEREIALNIKSAKSVVHKALEGLEDMQVIQRFTKYKSKTNYAINYHTLQGIFGGYSAVFQSTIAIEKARADKLIDFKNGRITRIRFCLENFYASMDRSTVRTWAEIQGPERMLLKRLFPDNDYCHEIHFR